jgi:hypothetical protein
MFRWSSAVVEALLIFGVLGALASHPGLRATLRAAPRRLQVAVAGVFVVWLTSQLAEIPLTTYPFMSWHMYGESRADAPVTGYRLRGTSCAGDTLVLPASGGAMGRRPVLSFGVQRAYAEAEDRPAQRTVALARVDSLLALVQEQWNRHPGNAPLCVVELQKVHIEARDIAAPLPPYVTVRRHTNGS